MVVPLLPYGLIRLTSRGISAQLLDDSWCIVRIAVTSKTSHTDHLLLLSPQSIIWEKCCNEDTCHCEWGPENSLLLESTMETCTCPISTPSYHSLFLELVNTLLRSSKDERFLQNPLCGSNKRDHWRSYAFQKRQQNTVEF
jgi:hypothetical protein